MSRSNILDIQPTWCCHLLPLQRHLVLLRLLLLLLLRLLLQGRRLVLEPHRDLLHLNGRGFYICLLFFFIDHMVGVMDDCGWGDCAKNLPERWHLLRWPSCQFFLGFSGTHRAPEEDIVIFGEIVWLKNRVVKIFHRSVGCWGSWGGGGCHTFCVRAEKRKV